MTGPEQANAGPAARRRGPLALYAGFTLLIVSVLASIWFTVRQQDAFDQVSHTLGVESQLALVTARLQEAETSSRGFLLTGRSDFLEPYEAAMRALPVDFVRLRA